MEQEGERVERERAGKYNEAERPAGTVELVDEAFELREVSPVMS
ncbi:MAG: hypothetical protein M5U01_34245 [Ardenticatenaceae bacterium]|nr:hypothetical protein [Ardenticatenaceae bacterium]